MAGAGYPEEHIARVVDAIQSGERITPIQMANRCRVTRRCIWSWVKSGKLPAPQGRGRKLRWWDWNQVKHIYGNG